MIKNQNKDHKIDCSYQSNDNYFQALLGFQFDIKLMINNNPYNIPEKPLKQSKVLIETAPLYPHQINRRMEQIELKGQPQSLKRSSMNICYENAFTEPIRIPCSPQHIKTFSQSPIYAFEHAKQVQLDKIVRELGEKLMIVSARVDNQDKRIGQLMESKKNDVNPLSQSIVFSHELGHLGSKQMEKNSIFSTAETQSQNSCEMLESLHRIQEEIDTLKATKQNFHEEVKNCLSDQREIITQSLILNFKQSLHLKFLEEEQKIKFCIETFSKARELKIISQINQFKSQILNIKEELKRIDENKSTRDTFSMKIKEKIEDLTLLMFDHHKDQSSFKAQVFSELKISQQSLNLIKQMGKELKDLKQQVQMDIKEKITSLSKIKVSSQKNKGQTFIIMYEQYEKMCLKKQLGEKNNKQCCKSRVYYMDSQGYLLDENQFYLVDDNLNKIKIEEQHLSRLKTLQLLY